MPLKGQRKGWGGNRLRKVMQERGEGDYWSATLEWAKGDGI